MQCETITSHSGTTHLVSPIPHSSSAGGHMVAGRIQTLCEFHIKPHESAPANGKNCQFCKKEIPTYEGRFAFQLAKMFPLLEEELREQYPLAFVVKAP